MKNTKYYALTTGERSAEIMIFGDITSWPWLDSDVSAYDLVTEINGLDVDVIDVHINSYGGEVNEALAITNALLRHPAQVTTYVDGFACSAATIIFMAGDKRIVGRYSNFLIHPAWARIEGNADDLRKEADDLDRITDQSVKAYMDRMAPDKTREELLDLMAEERFMTPEEVLDWGFATEIEELIKNDTVSQSAQSMVYDKLHQRNVDLEALASAVADKVLEKMAGTVSVPVEGTLNYQATQQALNDRDGRVFAVSPDMPDTTDDISTVLDAESEPTADSDTDKHVHKSFLQRFRERKEDE